MATTITVSQYDRIVDVHDLDTVARALRAALDEIHNPGCARANNYDVLDLIDQARTIVLKHCRETAPTL
jgi:hypothetical protein